MKIKKKEILEFGIIIVYSRHSIIYLTPIFTKKTFILISFSIILVSIIIKKFN